MEARDSDGVPLRKTAALPGFVSTAVLTSSDGLFGDNVEETRLTDAPSTRAQDAADYKPLYDRLQEMKDQKDKEWKEKNNPFAPPKALDDEEIQFIRDLESRQEATEKNRVAQLQDDRAEFLLAREAAKQTATASVPVPSVVKSAATVKKTGAVPSVVVKAKRKPESKSTAQSSETKKRKVQATVTVSSATAITGLVGYGSDSSSSDDER